MFERVGSLRLAEPTRAEFDATVSGPDLAQLAGRRSVRTLQCSSPVNDSVWQLLNESFFSLRPDVELRVYGHYSTECDLSFAKRMTNVRRFAADCLMSARNVEAISEMPHLDSLSLGIFELRDLAVLDLVSPALRTLRVGATGSTRLCLSVLGRFKSLTALCLEGQSNGIEVLGELEELEELTLSSITADLGHLAPLTRLRSLAIKLGSIRSFAAITGKASIKHLQLWHIGELKDADFLASLPGLQQIFLQSLKRVPSLPSLGMCPALRRVVLQNMKGLNDFTSFKGAPALEEFALVDGTRQQPEQLVPVLRNPMVRRVKALFGTDGKDQAFVRLRDAHGKTDWDLSTPFEYR